MATSVWDASGDREYVVEGYSDKCRNSVFITGPAGFCAEFDREEFVAYLKAEFNLVEAVEVALHRILEAA